MSGEIVEKLLDEGREGFGDVMLDRKVVELELKGEPWEAEWTR